MCNLYSDSSKLTLAYVLFKLVLKNETFVFNVKLILGLDLLIATFLQVFSRYEKHRQLILEEIFTSLARLPTSKRGLRNFRYLAYCNDKNQNNLL